MLPMFYPASPSPMSPSLMPQAHWHLTSLLLSITCLVSCTPGITPAHSWIRCQGKGDGDPTSPRHEEVKEGGGITIRLLALQSSGGNRIFQSAIGQGFFHKARVVALGKAETQDVSGLPGMGLLLLMGLPAVLGYS